MNKKEKNINQNIAFLKQLKDGFLEEARLYKEKNKDWDKMPSLSKVEIVYVIFPLLINPKRISETLFARLKVVAIDEWSMTLQYKVEQKSGLFHGPTFFTNKIQIKTSDFNKTWFVSSEIATEAVINKIENGDFFDPVLHDFVEIGMVRGLMIGRSH